MKIGITTSPPSSTMTRRRPSADGGMVTQPPLGTAYISQAPVGSVVRLEVAGHAPVTVAVGEDGRGRLATPEDGEPTTTLSMDRETFVVLAGGRRAAAADGVRISGDTPLGERVASALAVTP